MASGERWKRQERAVAAALGSRRLPNVGSGQPDVIAGGWAVQIKTRAALPGWLTAAVAQAERDAAPGERPAVVLCEARQGVKARRLVVLDFAAFLALTGGAAGEAEVLGDA